MKIPFQCVEACGSILVAARGGSIHTFDTEDGHHISSWSHPLSKSQATENDSNSKNDPEATDRIIQDDPDQLSGPASKRRKLDSDIEVKDDEGSAEAAETDVHETGDSKKGKKSKNKGGFKPNQTALITPMIICMKMTPDGRYIVAVTGQDKTIWVFEHDGEGNLKQLSERIMPKRPCSIVITADSQTIISADKFGDVYSLPLLSSASSRPVSSGGGGGGIAVPSKPRRFQANEFTVHTKNNRRIVETHQQQQQQQKQQPPRTPDKATVEENTKPEGTAAEHALILGHVMLLTAVELASHECRPYILTADRDEHIRVSRGLPQAHIIEGYCLGHTEFVSRLCVPPARPEVLVSGGGDDDLFVWDWRRGALLSRAPLLPLVRDVVAGAPNLAVSGLYSFSSPGDGGGVSMFAICERIPAVFAFTLVGGSLRHLQTIKVPGNPLDVTVTDATGSATPRLILAVDAAEAADGEAGASRSDEVTPSLWVLQQAGAAGWTVEKAGFQEDMSGVSSASEITRGELDKLLYTIETLRKSLDGDDGATDMG